MQLSLQASITAKPWLLQDEIILQEYLQNCKFEWIILRTSGSFCDADADAFRKSPPAKLHWWKYRISAIYNDTRDDEEKPTENRVPKFLLLGVAEFEEKKHIFFALLQILNE